MMITKSVPSILPEKVVSNGVWQTGPKALLLPSQPIIFLLLAKMLIDFVFCSCTYNATQSAKQIVLPNLLVIEWLTILQEATL